MEKFHYFLYGKEFTLETDQKPLVSIYKEHVIDISPRVQRLIVNSAFSPIMSSSFCSLLVCGKVRVCLYTLGNIVRWYASSLLGSYIQQEYYVAVIQT